MADRVPGYRKYQNYEESNKRSKQSHRRDSHQLQDNECCKDRCLMDKNSTKAATPCYYYIMGKCSYNERCRYSHDEPMEFTRHVKSTSNSFRSDVFIERPSTSSCQNGCNFKRSSRNDDCDKKQFGSSHNRYINEDANEENAACASAHFTFYNNKNWVEAPEFVPREKTKTYAKVVNDCQDFPKVCPYLTRNGVCTNPIMCEYAHGDFCDLCARHVLHPYNEVDRKKHRQECISRHEKDMELSFAIQRSKGKTCGICFEIIIEKEDGEQRFGILPNCSHCFCLACIRTWRKKKRGFENKIIRACPECRVTSDFVCPSVYWVDSKEDKDKLIDDYKKVLSNKDCKYFKKGVGKCPFGNKCFYMHRHPDGHTVDVGPPPRQRRQRSNYGETDVLQVMLWDFLDEREFPWRSLAEDLDDLVAFFTDSDESDWSDYEIFFD